MIVNDACGARLREPSFANMFCGTMFCGTMFCGTRFCGTRFCGTRFCGTRQWASLNSGKGLFLYFKIVILRAVSERALSGPHSRPLLAGMGRAREQARRTLCLVEISTRSLRATRSLATTPSRRKPRVLGTPGEDAGSLTPFEMTSLIGKKNQTDPLPGTMICATLIGATMIYDGNRGYRRYGSPAQTLRRTR
jgi:hypothetical protein